MLEGGPRRKEGRIRRKGEREEGREGRRKEARLAMALNFWFSEIRVQVYLAVYRLFRSRQSKPSTQPWNPLQRTLGICLPEMNTFLKGYE